MTTTATVDDKQRVRIPNAKPGQLLTIQGSPDGGWTVTPVKEMRPKAVWLKNIKPLAAAEAKRCWGEPDPEFDRFAAHCAKL